jgi:hypothetical protein
MIASQDKTAAPAHECMPGCPICAKLPGGRKIEDDYEPREEDGVTVWGPPS